MKFSGRKGHLKEIHKRDYHREWDLSKPNEARNFLKELRIGKAKAKIEFLRDEAGRDIRIDDASDKQILQVVRELSRNK